MATNLESRTPGVALTRFWGGQERGTCVQVNARKWQGHAQLTRTQAAQLAHDLMAFADGLETEEWARGSEAYSD